MSTTGNWQYKKKSTSKKEKKNQNLKSTISNVLLYCLRRYTSENKIEIRVLVFLFNAPIALGFFSGTTFYDVKTKRFIKIYLIKTFEFTVIISILCVFLSVI